LKTFYLIAKYRVKLSTHGGIPRNEFSGENCLSGLFFILMRISLATQELLEYSLSEKGREQSCCMDFERFVVNLLIFWVKQSSLFLFLCGWSRIG
jgi:hypothetical protein